MDEKYIALVTDYLDGNLSEEDQKAFDRYVKEGQIDLQEIEGLKNYQEKMQASNVPEPSAEMSASFYSLLSEEKRKLNSSHSGTFLNRFIQEVFATNLGRFAFGLSILVVGLLIGRIFTSNTYDNKLETLSTQMADMKEMMMMAMLEEESVTQRLKGVQMSSGIVSKNQSVTDALFITLNNDESTNVRLAALATLSQYADDPRIRERLVKSISQQESPLVQVTLAELMVELQETQALEKFEPILNAENTPDDVKSVLRENLRKIM